MKKYLLFPAIIVFSACKFPQDKAKVPAFDVKINNADIKSATLPADISKTNTVIITTGAHIDDNKQLVVSVSSGSLSPDFNLSNSVSQITLTIQDGKATCYYNTGRKGTGDGNLSVSIGGVTQLFNYNVGTSEPDYLQLSANPSHPTATGNVDLVAYLFKNTAGEYSSDNLPVSFTVQANSPDDSISVVLPQPNFAYSMFDATSDLCLLKKQFR